VRLRALVVVTELLVLELAELAARARDSSGAASTYLMASAMIPNMTSIILFQYRLQGEILKKITLKKCSKVAEAKSETEGSEQWERSR